LVKAGETIYIRPDGSIEGTTSIQTVDNVTYYFVADINGSITVERDYIVLDGAGHTLQGLGTETGISLSGRTNVTVQKMRITAFVNGIEVCNCTNVIIFGNDILENSRGIHFLSSSSNGDVFGNNITANGEAIRTDGMSAYGENIYRIYQNNFVDNGKQRSFVPGWVGTIFWNLSYPFGGNYWSGYDGIDSKSGPYQNESGSDGIGDSKYTVMEQGHMATFYTVVEDYYPLTVPFGSNLPLAFPTANFTYAPSKPEAGQPVVFNASISLCPNGTIIGYSWDFGDGENNTGQVVSHTYAIHGSYFVALTTLSSTRIPDTKNQSIYVRQTPLANFSFSPIPKVGYPATFDASESNPQGGNITDYVWDFGDGNETSTDEPLIYHVFNYQDTFNVTLTVFDTDDFNATLSESVFVSMPTFVSITTSSTSSIVGFSVDINGSITDFYGVLLKNEGILLSYTFPGASTWSPITSATTDSSGSYRMTWIPTATGDFTVKAEYSGNETHLSSSSVVFLSTLPDNNNGVLSVESNSTISAFSFDSSTSKLTFSVSGENNTIGYVKVRFAKSLAESAADIRVFLDGNQTDPSVTSTDSSWQVVFTYSQSEHTLEIDLNAASPEDALTWGFWALVAGCVAAIAAVTTGVLVVKRSRHKKLHNAS
jgi:parallel beta-helix repeat protein